MLARALNPRWEPSEHLDEVVTEVVDPLEGQKLSAYEGSEGYEEEMARSYDSFVERLFRYTVPKWNYENNNKNKVTFDSKTNTCREKPWPVNVLTRNGTLEWQCTPTSRHVDTARDSKCDCAARDPASQCSLTNISMNSETLWPMVPGCVACSVVKMACNHLDLWRPEVQRADFGFFIPYEEYRRVTEKLREEGQIYTTLEVCISKGIKLYADVMELYFSKGPFCAWPGILSSC